MKMYSFRDVPIGDVLLATRSGDQLSAALREAIAEPWFVIDPNGKRWLAYGPWQVIEWTRSPMRFGNEVRVVRWNVRRTSAQLSKYPLGILWDEKQMGPLDIHLKGAVVTHEDNGTNVKSTIGNTYIRSQVSG